LIKCGVEVPPSEGSLNNFDNSFVPKPAKRILNYVVYLYSVVYKTEETYDPNLLTELIEFYPNISIKAESALITYKTTYDKILAIAELYYNEDIMPYDDFINWLQDEKSRDIIESALLTV
jgi:hypothetical protein